MAHLVLRYLPGKSQLSMDRRFTDWVIANGRHFDYGSAALRLNNPELIEDLLHQPIKRWPADQAGPATVTDQLVSELKETITPEDRHIIRMCYGLTIRAKLDGVAEIPAIREHDFHCCVYALDRAGVLL